MVLLLLGCCCILCLLWGTCISFRGFTCCLFFCPPPFFFIVWAEDGGGEKGSLEVFAMTDKSRGNEDGGGDYQSDYGSACV